mgnify:CR=1 FL=1
MKKYTQVIGIIDNYDAIHYRKIASPIDEMHDHFWPTCMKRWRFFISEWNLSKSILYQDRFTEEEEDKILALMRKICTPPRWVIVGEIWDKHGRPRIGKKRKAYEKELEEKGLSPCI